MVEYGWTKIGPFRHFISSTYTGIRAIRQSGPLQRGLWLFHGSVEKITDIREKEKKRKREEREREREEEEGRRRRRKEA